MRIFLNGLTDFPRSYYDVALCLVKKNKPPHLNMSDSRRVKIFSKIAAVPPGKVVSGTEIEYNI
jgi:ADP-glucose pyrophosphorylase